MTPQTSYVAAPNHKAHQLVTPACKDLFFTIVYVTATMPSPQRAMIVVLVGALLAVTQAAAKPNQPVWPATNHDSYNARFARAPSAPRATFARSFNTSSKSTGMEPYVVGAVAPTSQGHIVMLMSDAPSSHANTPLTVVALDGTNGNTLWNTSLPQLPLPVLVYGSNSPVLLVDTQDNIVLVLANQTLSSVYATPVVVVLSGETGDVIPEVRRPQGGMLSPNLSSHVSARLLASFCSVVSRVHRAHLPQQWLWSGSGV